MVDELPELIIPKVKKFQLSGKQTRNFWNKVNLNGSFIPHLETKCFEWEAGKFTDGYGAFIINGKVFKAHRVSWMLKNGNIPRNMCICHRCDNRSCVNPIHLFLGTNVDNVRDRVIKNRSASQIGESNGSSKITSEIVIKIRSMNMIGHSLESISRLFDVSPSLIRFIVKRKLWKHV